MSGDDDDFAERNRRLARELLDAMQQPASPEPVEPEPVRARARALARTSVEMVFAASLLPCPQCGTREPARLDLIGGGTSWSLTGQCSQCGARRSYAWQTEGHPLHGVCRMRELGDERPSQIIRVGHFLDELDRLVAVVGDDPSALAPAEWRASLAALERAITCVLELAKFVPANMRVISDLRLDEDERRDRAARPERYRAERLAAERDRLLVIRERFGEDAPRIWALEARDEPPSRGEIDRASLRAHADWVRAGRDGRGRLDVVGAISRELRLAGAMLECARLERCTLDGAVIESARMAECEVRDVSLRDSAGTSLHLSRAVIVGGSFARSRLALAVLADASVESTSFEATDLDRSDWRGATVTGATFDRAVFGNAWLDGATFRRCSFVDADFRPITAGIRATTAGARFEDCDLHGTRWEGRDLAGVTFVGCEFAGSSGRR